MLTAAAVVGATGLAWGADAAVIGVDSSLTTADTSGDDLGDRTYNLTFFGGTGGRETRSLLGFDISGGGDATDIASAASIVLTATVDSIENLDGDPESNLNFSVFGIADGSLDFDDGPSAVAAYQAAGTLIQSFSAVGLMAGDTIEVDVTEFVKAESLAGETYSNFRIQVTNPAAFPKTPVNGSGRHELLLVDDAATLTTVVPEPGMMGLAGAGLLCLLPSRRRMVAFD